MPDAVPAETRVAESIRAAFARIKEYLVGLLGEFRDEEGTLAKDQFNVTRLGAILPQLKARLEEQGFSDIAEREAEEIQGLYELAVEEIGEAKLSQEWKATSDQAIELILSGTTNEVLRLRDDLASQLEQLLTRTLISAGAKITDIIQEMTRIADLSMNQAITLAATTLHAFSRQITLDTGSEAGIEWFLFTGPDDNRIREWCSHFVGTRVTVDILEDYKNSWGRDKQPEPVDAYLGGYNCRHRLVPLIKGEKSEYPEGPTE